jgi:hypothetical protein
MLKTSNSKEYHNKMEKQLFMAKKKKATKIKGWEDKNDEKNFKRGQVDLIYFEV